MNIVDVINDAKYGELSQLAIKDNTNAVLSYIYLGMLELYKRFTVKVEEVKIELDGFNTIYNMPSNCLKILSAYDEEGNEYVLNDEDDALSILTPTYNTIQVPNPTEGAFVICIYSATPTRITYDSETDTFTPSVLELPLGLYEALLHYIGYRGHGSVDGKINAENSTHYTRFDKSCTKAKEIGVITEDNTTNYKLDDRGFK